MRRQAGFTLIELMIVIAILGVLTAFAVPNFISWLPKYRLKSAADELFSNLQLAKMQAIRTGQNCTVAFTAAGYTIDCLDDKTITLADYGSGVTFKNHPADGEPDFTTPITFNSRGMAGAGSAYLTNAKGTSYLAVVVASTGVIRIKKWNGTDDYE